MKEIGKYGVGYNVSSEGNNVVLPGFQMEMPVGSYAMRYAKENSIPYHGRISKNAVLLTMIGAVLVILLIVGIIISIRRSQAKKREEEERAAQEQKEKLLAERRAARKKQKEQKE